MVCGVFANIFFSVCDYFFLYQWSQGMIWNIIKMIGMTYVWFSGLWLWRKGRVKRQSSFETIKIPWNDQKSAVSPKRREKNTTGGCRYSNIWIQPSHIKHLFILKNKSFALPTSCLCVWEMWVKDFLVYHDACNILQHPTELGGCLSFADSMNRKRDLYFLLYSDYMVTI